MWCFILCLVLVCGKLLFIWWYWWCFIGVFFLILCLNWLKKLLVVWVFLLVINSKLFYGLLLKLFLNWGIKKIVLIICNCLNGCIFFMIVLLLLWLWWWCFLVLFCFFLVWIICKRWWVLFIGLFIFLKWVLSLLLWFKWLWLGYVCLLLSCLKCLKVFLSVLFLMLCLWLIVWWFMFFFLMLWCLVLCGVYLVNL